MFFLKNAIYSVKKTPAVYIDVYSVGIIVSHVTSKKSVGMIANCPR